MLEKIVSGGQTGADRAGLDAAISCGIPHGGWCPRGRKAEDGTIPERYHLIETAGASYLARTERNVKRSDGTVIFTMGAMTGGALRTADFARRHRKPWLHLDLSGLSAAKAVEELGEFVARNDIRTLNVAGSRGSSHPELYDRVFDIVVAVITGTPGDATPGDAT